MLTDLLASAREIRNPLTIGYSALFTLWLIAGDSLEAAARKDVLGARLLQAYDSAGDAAQIAVLTFCAAMIGSVLWHLGVARLVRGIAIRSRHPDWPAYIDRAKQEVRYYEQYRVVTHKGQHGDRPSPFDADHEVPSAHWADYLHERVEERERKGAEMAFRVTLALSLLPVAIALGIEGGGSWWWSLLAIPVVWLDVALLKYTTLRTVRRYQLEDARSELERTESDLQSTQSRDFGQMEGAAREQLEERRREDVRRLQVRVGELEAEIKRLESEAARRMTRFFDLLEGASPD